MIEIEVVIPAPVKDVWQKLTSQDHLRKWWHKDITIDAVKDGKFSMTWTDQNNAAHITLGTITAIETDVRLQMDWQDPSWVNPTRVEFLLSPSGSGTRLFLQHSGWGVFEKEKDRQNKVDAHANYWETVLEKLKNACLE